MIADIDKARCTGCGLCVEKCPLDVFRLRNNEMIAGMGTNKKSTDSNMKAYIAYPEDCMTCYSCELICPAEAIDVHPFKESMPRAY